MIVYCICYIISFLLSRQHVYMLSGLFLIAAALWMYGRDYRTSGNLIHLRGLFCLFFIGGQGISCFKLSRLQTDWSTETWVCFFAATVCFWMAFALISCKMNQKEKNTDRQARAASKEQSCQAKRILTAMAFVTGISWLAFLFEAWKLGFVPLFSYGVPHAYSYFHVSGVHYFTVSCVLTPALFVAYMGCLKKDQQRPFLEKKSILFGIFLSILALLIPLLCVSRFQLILAVGMAVITYISISGFLRFSYACQLTLCLGIAYVGLTVMRSHSVEYLNGIFEMKNSSTPIFITQPYMYIANNYDNFNCLVEQLPDHSLGLKMLFPLWAFSGLKFLMPSLVNFPLFVTKEELTTLTLFYDAYYDFGLAGVIVFALALGGVCGYLVKRREKCSCPVGHVLYAQIAMYMTLSFFTTWFSNPATWFYLAATGAVFFYTKTGSTLKNGKNM